MRATLAFFSKIKSNILPILALGGYGTHISYQLTWAHEHDDNHPRFIVLQQTNHILNYLD